MRRAFGWGVVVVAFVAGARLISGSRPATDAEIRGRAVASLRFLSDDLEGKADRMQRLFPEGRAFTLALTGIAWTHVGLEDADVDDALPHARRALEAALAPASLDPFGPTAELPHGLFYDAWATRLQTGVVRLARHRRDDLEADTSGLRARCRRLRSALEDGPLFPDSYPGMAWPADAVVAAAALEGCARTVDPSSRAAARAWVRRASESADRGTGLMPHAAGASAPRGSSTALMIPFLIEVDSAFGAGQYRHALEAFPASLLGVLPTMREYPKGTDGQGDIDSGPLVAGISAPASVVSVAAARSVGDLETASALLASTEWIGLPVAFAGRRRFAAGALPVGDAFVAWASTVPLAPSRAGPTFQGWRARWRWTGAVLVALALGLTAAMLRRQSPSRASLATMGR